MGYYVTITESSFHIPTKNLDEAYDRMCALNDRDDLKGGGSSNGDKWFSWMAPNYPEVCIDAEHILNELGFETDHFHWMNESAVYITGYDNKIGDEDKFLAAISDLAEGSIEWRGEDGSLWKVEYGEKEPVEYAAIVQWEKVK